MYSPRKLTTQQKMVPLSLHINLLFIHLFILRVLLLFRVHEYSASHFRKHFVNLPSGGDFQLPKAFRRRCREIWVRPCGWLLVEAAKGGGWMSLRFFFFEFFFFGGEDIISRYIPQVDKQEIYFFPGNDHT